MTFSIDVTQAVNAMVGAASGYLTGGGPKANDYARHEFQQFEEDLDHIQGLLNAGSITQEDAQYYTDLQKSSMTAVLLTIKELRDIEVQNAINAALGLLKSLLGSALSLKI